MDQETYTSDAVRKIVSDKYIAVRIDPVSYTHLRAHEPVLALVCRLLLEHKKI